MIKYTISQFNDIINTILQSRNINSLLLDNFSTYFEFINADKQIKKKIIYEENELVNILCKLSVDNKDKLFNDIKKIKFRSGDIEILHKYSIDLIYLSHIFSELIKFISTYDDILYTNIVDYIKIKVKEDNTDKRFEINNCILFSELYLIKCISNDDINDLLNYFFDKMKYEHYLIIIKKISNIILIKKEFKNIEFIAYENKLVEAKIKYIAVDILDMIEE